MQYCIKFCLYVLPSCSGAAAATVDLGKWQDQQQQGASPKANGSMVSLFGKKKEGRTLRPRVRRATPLMDVGLAVVLGAVTGVYIFKDTLQRWQISEGEYVAAEVNKTTQAQQNAQAASAQDTARS
ncbi:hypothetical protein PF006_g10073 [Phytophthora fragariae]|uniref:Uncharacterized protein n=1 Tax=Phytophthora fragariae TaxID=53985 RepID=A0A6A3U5Q1_9STRA|nr:hypothetical protein PF006_g10073 [Phytophthora fragariae]